MIFLKLDIKSLIKNIAIPLILGTIVGLLTSTKGLENIAQPVFAPPAFLFPIVWTILYTLMGVSAYMVEGSTSPLKDDALGIYYLQLGVNLLWSFIFFTFRLYFIAFLWIILLIFLSVDWRIQICEPKKITNNITIQTITDFPKR